MMSSNFRQKYFAQKSWFFILVFGSCLLNSCVTVKKTTYLQEYKSSEYSEEYTPPTEYLIQPYDNLFIRVTTPDPRMSEMFNTVAVGGLSLSEQAVDLISYTVQLDGTVDLPYLGPIYVAGKTIAEAKEVLIATIEDYITDAAITVKLVNNYVSVIGEVLRPGRYPIYKGQMNIFQALAMAGDIADFGDRYKINIIRQTNEGTITKAFDLTDKNIIDSEFFYVMPNDVIYAQPMKGKVFGFNQLPFVLILSSITTFILILNYIQ